jgi:cyclopropane fatty-acyl-phospholipid synthase-like methyltransferase
MGKLYALCDTVLNTHRDYRDIPINVGVKFNKISCIEMAEHVGVKNFLKFLEQVRELLADDGIFLLQIAGLRRAFQVHLSIFILIQRSFNP